MSDLLTWTTRVVVARWPARAEQPHAQLPSRAGPAGRQLLQGRHACITLPKRRAAA
jgi:hypothetical protein